MPRNSTPSPNQTWFHAKIAAKSGSGPTARYGFTRRGVDGSGNVTNIANVFNPTVTELPGVCLTGADLSVGAEVLARPAPWAGGTFYEIEPIGGGASTTTTTTSTTAAPCSGTCDWTFTDGAWTLASSGCSDPCHCSSPQWCPTSDEIDSWGCASTTTQCATLAADETPLDCASPEATTTRPPECTTTTTIPPGCTDGCDWYCVPGRGWWLVSHGCTSNCPCALPATACVDCDSAHTDCNFPQPGSYCTGSVRWLCVFGVPGIEDHWEQYFGGCSSTPDQGPCYADPPSVPCDACAKQVDMPCYRHYVPGSPTQAPGCAPYVPSTTTSAPGRCIGNCLFKSDDGETWTVARSCLDCGCQEPDRSPASSCDTELGACVPGTTTAGPTTTTTTVAPTVCADQSTPYVATSDYCNFSAYGASQCFQLGDCTGFQSCRPDTSVLPPPIPQTPENFGICPSTGTIVYVPCHCGTS